MCRALSLIPSTREKEKQKKKKSSNQNKIRLKYNESFNELKNN
jgi:hypothetical protein